MLLPLFYKLPELTFQVQSTYSPILDTHSPLALLVWLVCIAFASPYTTLCSCYLAVVLVAAKLHCGWNSVWCVPTAVLISFIGLSYILLSIEFSSLFSILFSIERETAREIEQQTKLALALPP